MFGLILENWQDQRGMIYEKNSTYSHSDLGICGGYGFGLRRIVQEQTKPNEKATGRDQRQIKFDRTVEQQTDNR